MTLEDLKSIARELARVHDDLQREANRTEDRLDRTSLIVAIGGINTAGTAIDSLIQRREGE